MRSLEHPSPQAGVLEAASELYHRGQFLSTRQLLADQFGPMEKWVEPDLRLLGGRLCHQLAAPRRGKAFHFWTFRRNRTHAEAAYYYLSSCIAESGPFRQLRVAERLRASLPMPDLTRAHVLGLEAHALASFRDFERAFERLEQAEGLSPADAWLHVERSYVLMQADRVQEALEHTAEALRIRPAYIPAVRHRAIVLAELERSEEAIELLAQATAASEAGSLFWQRGTLEAQLGRHAEADRAFEQALELLPLIEPEARRALLSQRADASYMSGQFAIAQQLAAEVGTPYYRGFAERLGQGMGLSGRKLPGVPWVRQKHMTCAPATLASIARHFELPVDHDELAHEICYGGTHDHGERTWAERSGFRVREFTVTREIAHALIDRGIPFALTTVEPTSAHLQAVHGYDLTRGTLLVRDPSLRFDAEYDAALFLENYRACGPRGMLFLPANEAHRLAQLALPDEDRYDALSELRKALSGFDREAAEGALARLVELGPEHRLAHEGALLLAHYDRDSPRANQHLESLLRAFPDALRWVLYKSDVMADIAPLSQREALLDRFALRPKAHPAVVRARAQLLADDVRRGEEARFWLRKAVRTVPSDALNTQALANSAWSDRRFDEAFALYRFAACSQDTNEHYAQSYFRAARLLGKVEEGLSFLRARVARYAHKSLRPLESLFEAYRVLDRHDEGFGLLETALDERADGPLYLFAADAFARRSQFERARALLEQARGRVAQNAFTRAAARLATLEGDAVRSRALYAELTQADPLDVDAQDQLAGQLSESRGTEAATLHVVDVCARFPHHFGLASLRLTWAKRTGRKHVEPALRALLALSPHAAWVQREYGFWLTEEQRFDEALRIAQEQLALSPASVASWGLAGVAHAGKQQRDAAREAFRKALSFDPDYVFALESLMELAANVEERRAELERLYALFERAVIGGTGLLRFATFARGVLTPERALEMLESARKARPDLPAVYLALCGEHCASGRIDAAHAVISEACATFAYRCDLWLAQADVCALRRDEEGRLRALERAHEVEPDDSHAASLLVEELLARREFERARALCEAGVLRDPSHVPLQLLRANALYRAGERERALVEVERLCTIEPGVERAWSTLDEWGAELGRPDAALQAARLLTEKRPDEARSWLVLARRLVNGGDFAELKRALERATQLNPQLADAYDLLAYACAEHGAWVDALAACAPPALAAAPPVTLRGRRCWVLARRGSLRDAIAEMEALLREVPDYVTGTRWLCDFYESAGDAEKHAYTARRLAQLTPDSAPTHGYVGAALLDLGDRAGAKEHFWRAIALDADYHYAGVSVFDLHLEDGELSEASDALQRLRASQPEAIAVQRRLVQLKAAQNDEPAALDAFGALLRAEDVDMRSVSVAAESLEEREFVAQLDEAYLEALADPTTQPSALAPWVDRALGEWPLRTLARVLKGELATPGAQAVSNLVTRLADGAVARWKLRLFFFRHKAALLRHTPVWGAVGYALICFAAHRTCTRWLGDYARRADAEPWQLYNLATALRRVGRDERALAVHRAALALGADHTADKHSAWVAFLAALAGEIDAARAALDACARSELDGEPRFARGCAQLLLAADVLARRTPYRLIAPLRFSLEKLIARAGLSVGDNPPIARAVSRLIARIAGTRPRWQALWISLTWRWL